MHIELKSNWMDIFAILLQSSLFFKASCLILSSNQLFLVALGKKHLPIILLRPFIAHYRAIHRVINRMES